MSGLSLQRRGLPHVGDGEVFEGHEVGGVMGDPHLALPLPPHPPLPRRHRLRISPQAALGIPGPAFKLRQREPPAIPPRGVSSSYIAVPPLPASLSQGRSSPVVYFLCPVEEMCVSCPPLVKPRRSVSLLTQDGGSSGVTSFPAPSASMTPCALDKRPQGRRQDSRSLDVRL